MVKKQISFSGVANYDRIGHSVDCLLLEAKESDIERNNESSKAAGETVRPSAIPLVLSLKSG